MICREYIISCNDGEVIYHCDDGPAYIFYFDENKVKQEIWYKNGLVHRENDEPAIIEYYENGNIKQKQWYVDGNLHREKKPAYIDYDENQKIILEKYYDKGIYYE